MAFETFDSDRFPWETKAKLYGETLPQHASYFPRGSKKSKKKIKENESLALLEDLRRRFESDVEIYVFSNRFQDPTHDIDWHKDTYGCHIFVLSLGSQRTVDFPENKTRNIESVKPGVGDLYFMPKYADEFEVSFKDKATGFLEGFPRRSFSHVIFLKKTMTKPKHSISKSRRNFSYALSRNVMQSVFFHVVTFVSSNESKGSTLAENS